MHTLNFDPRGRLLIGLVALVDHRPDRPAAAVPGPSDGMNAPVDGDRPMESEP